MAKRKTSNRRKSRSRKSSEPGILDGIFSIFRADAGDPESREKSRRVIAWTLLFFGVLSLLACVSYFYTGKADQSVLEPGAENQPVSNWLGFIGAKIADLLIYKGFGIFGFLIPLYIIFISLVMLEDEYYYLLRQSFKYVAFGLIWGSVFLAYILILSNPAPSSIPVNFDLGGGVGYAINTSLFTYVGRIGVAFLLLFALMIFAVVNFNAEVRASRIVSGVAGLGEAVRYQAQNLAGSGKSTPRNRPLPKSKSLSNGRQKEESDEASGVVTEKEDSISPTQAEAGEQISLDVNPPVLKKASKKKSGTPISAGDLELTIEQPNEEEMVVPTQPELEQIGEDNIGKVVGSDNQVMRIIPAQDLETDNKDEVIDWEQFDPTKELSNYNPPVLELLDDHGAGQNWGVNSEELNANKNKIVETLANYGIEIVNIKATIGPTVTLYEIVPAPGVRISKIRNLEDDIALSLAALGIRIIAPIPGKGTIGIEVPNSKRETVSLRGVLSTVKFQTTSFELPVAIGRDIANKVFIADLNKMPHLLIAGATGQGKSVGLNTIITSLLYKKHPSEMKFVLIDPKKVEMTLYQSLAYHFLAQMPDQEEPIITDVSEAVKVLKSLCVEMDQRYELLKSARVRNLKEYNQKFIKRTLNPRKGHRFLPYILLVIDELADMMMVAGKEVEMPIARLAQLARAVGIHLVVATQRPSVNIITGIIKANFPARMSYRVISKVDSRTILDANGADQLVGRGDLLLAMGSELTRIQNAFIDTPEVEKVVDFIAQQRGYPEPYFLPEIIDEKSSGDSDEPLELDDNFEEAARVIVRHQIGSASLIQRKLKLGYNRAGRIIDQLERAKIVGPHSGSKAREVLISDEAELERYLSNLL
ncbi:MAG: DNA translocase FtsK [Bacteroidota bacterium]